MTSTLLWKLPLILKRYFGWTLLILMAIAAPASALELRVVIQEASQVTLGSSTPAKISDAAGQSLGALAPLEGFHARPSSNGVTLANKQANQIWIQPSNGGYIYVGEACAPACGGHWYRGKVKLVRTPKGVIVVNHVDLEQYLASVLGKEMYSSWPQEALKAQAVAARSYALVKQQRNNGLYDLGSTTANQVYAGVDSESVNTQAAVAATAGQILTYQGKVIEAVFHSASGGHTENSENVWSAVVPYLRGVPDFDQSAPVYQWTISFTTEQLKQRLPGLGNVLSMTPVSTTPQGRVKLMKVVGTSGSRLVKGDQLRSALGLKSTLFTVTPELGLVASANPKAAPKPIAFQFNGRGYGHGLGMSQWGAYSLAQQGRTYQDILSHYYQGTILTKIGL